MGFIRDTKSGKLLPNYPAFLRVAAVSEKVSSVVAFTNDDSGNHPACCIRIISSILPLAAADKNLSGAEVRSIFQEPIRE